MGRWNKTSDCQIEVHERDCAIHHFLEKRFLKLKISKVLQNVSFAVSAGVKERVKQVTISPLCPPCGKRVQERRNGKKWLHACAHSCAFVAAVPASANASYACAGRHSEMEAFKTIAPRTLPRSSYESMSQRKNRFYSQERIFLRYLIFDGWLKIIAKIKSRETFATR